MPPSPNLSETAAPLDADRRVVCHCAGVSAGQIRRCAAEQPGITPREVCEQLGCAMQCGSCQPAVMEALGEQAWWPALARSTPISTGRTQAEAERAIYRVQLQLEHAGEAAYPLARPGQHVVLRMAVPGGELQRSFTLVSQAAHGGALQLAVRRVPGGGFTPALLDPDAPVALQVSAPAGAGFVVGDGRAAVFFAGGIGITPAISLFMALPPGSQGLLHWSIAQPGDAVLAEERLAIAQRHPGLPIELHDASRHGFLSAREVQRLAARHPGARFHLCGPPPYLQALQAALLDAGVPARDLHIEQFVVPDAPAEGRSPRRLSFRWKSYLAGLLLAGSAGVLVSQTPERSRPHGPPNVGHETLQCIHCHDPAAGSTRQVLQAKTHHHLGLRERGAVFGQEPVSNPTCLACHANFDDRHAPSRFLEPRFDQARADTGAHQCISCHREHQGVRIAAPQAAFCMSCHSDMKLSPDPATPSHAQLVREKRWDSCLQCHDYHGNHRWKAPLRLEEGIPLQRLHDYFRHAPSPYGETVVKAQEPAATAAADRPASGADR